MLAALLLLIPEPTELRLKVGEADRFAFVYESNQKDAPVPVVFAFHGHGGQARQVANRWRIHLAWPEAIVIYPQGLPTATPRDPNGQRSGWSSRRESRDIAFFDAALAWVKRERKVDLRRVYAMGHSNGAGFVYGLAVQRGDVFAAIGPSAAAPKGMAEFLKPLPIFHVAGRQDTIVPFSEQTASFAVIERQLGIVAGSEKTEGALTRAVSEKGVPFVKYLHDGGHQFVVESMKPMIDFFKANPKRS